MAMKISITSIGRAAAQWQVPVDTIRRVAAELNIHAHRLNGIPHFDDDDLRLIDEHIRQEQRAAV